MSQWIVGLHPGHNASVCIGDQQGIKFAIQEERLTQEKNYWGFPKQALKACLDAVGASNNDIAAICHGGQHVVCRYHSREDVILAHRRQQSLTGRIRQRVVVPLVMSLAPRYGQKEFEQHLAHNGLGQVPVHYYNHHYAHAATAYYGLRKNHHDDYLVLTCDGQGDNVSGSIGVMNGRESRQIALTSWQDSLGALYAWVTYAMGFVPLEHEYKLMGMAPYASESRAATAAAIFHRYLGLDASGLRFKRKQTRRTNDLIDILHRDLQGCRFDDICAGLQRFTEDLLCAWVANAIRATGVRRVVAAGGVFMNVKANQRIAALPEVDYFEAFPSCGDETLSLGAFWLESKKRFGDAAVQPLKHFYLGADLSTSDIDRVLSQCDHIVERPSQIATTIADILAAGYPIARVDGPMEFGARALGNRSILADPINYDTVRVINQMVKKRDFWMPFAPMVMAERAHEYLRNPKKLTSPFMMMAFDTQDNFRDLIAAVHNGDLTCRAQILEREQNPKMHDILKAFEAKTGRAVVLNTSYNLHGFPLVRSADDAMDVFNRSGLQYMQLGNALVRKRAAN